MNDWEILSDVFDDLDAPHKFVCSVVEFRKHLWKKYHINKIKFQEMLQRVYNDPKFGQKIGLYGGSIYLKDNWVKVNDRHYLLIQIDTPQHLKYMVGHRG